MSQKFIVIATQRNGYSAVWTNKGWVTPTAHNEVLPGTVVQVMDSATACKVRDDSKRMRVNKDHKFHIVPAEG